MINHGQITKRPNILIILTDQQRADAIGYTNPLVRTPNFNLLASKSIVCTKTVVQSPQCQPSRASIFTGRYPTAHKVWWNETPLPLTERTIANYLAISGYSTGYFGKLHFHGQGGPTETAKHFGFQESFLFEDWQTFIAQHSLGKGGNIIEKEFYRPMNRAGWMGRLTHQEWHHEEVITGKALDFIKSTRSPWFVTVGFHGPHPPYASPDEFSGLYRMGDMPVPNKIVHHGSYRMTSADWQRLKVQYYGSISWIDSCVGRLLASVDRDTIIVCTSDHGDILGDHGYFSKGLFAYDGNILVPLLIKLPGVDHCVYDYLVQSIDIVPTILKLVGLTVPPGVQGTSIMMGVSSGKPIREVALSMIGHSPRLRMMRTPRYKYWIYGDSEFVFDLVNDPKEEVLVEDRAVISELRLKMIQSLIQAEDPLPCPQ